MKVREYIKENNIPKYNEWHEFYQLTDEEFEELEYAVALWLPTKLKSVNYKAGSSYYLKHLFEAYLGFYVSNYDFKIIMGKLGYKSKPYPGYSNQNLYYNISRKELNELEKTTRERKERGYKRFE